MKKTASPRSRNRRNHGSQQAPPRLDERGKITIVDQTRPTTTSRAVCSCRLAATPERTRSNQSAASSPMASTLLMGEIDWWNRRTTRSSWSTATVLDYDYLIIATGTHPNARGDPRPRRRRVVQVDLRLLHHRRRRSACPKLETWEGGKLVVNDHRDADQVPRGTARIHFLADAFFGERECATRSSSNT